MNIGPRHIRERYPAQVEVVRRALATAFAKQLPESEDFERDAVLFRTPNGCLVTVSEEFFSDVPATAISARLAEWRVAEKAKALGQSDRLVVTTDGTFVEQRG